MLPTPNPSEVTIEGKQYGLIAFYFPDHDTAWDSHYKAPYLGNFWQTPVTLTHDKITGNFHTAEAAFQATKWWKHDHIRLRFEKAKTGTEAFDIKRDLDIAPDYSYDGLLRDGAMEAVLAAKFSNSEMKQGLLDTGSAYLLEHNSKVDRDDYWSDNHDGKGENKLGVLLMELRATLGGSGNPCDHCQVISFTQNVQTSYDSPSVKGPIAEGPKPSKGVTVIASIFQGHNQEGDFEWMISRDEYADAFFIFNDNESQFLEHQKDPSNPNGCAIGGGNAVIRPWQCKTPPRAGGIPTGPNYLELTPEVKSIIDEAITSIKKVITENNYARVYFSSNEKGGLGTKIFKVGDDVKSYIVEQIHSLAEE